jgi:hypothetical protein
MSNNYLRFPPGPSLPISPKDWDAGYHDQYSNVLRLYFNQLSNNLQQLSGPRGGYRLSFPHGAFYDTTVHNAASTTQAYVITLNSTSLSNGVSLIGGSRMTVSQEGIYNLQFSVQLNNPSNAPHDIDIWVRQNGVDIPNSNSRFGLHARKNPGDPFHVLAALNIFADMKEGDYLELVWWTSNTTMSLTGYAAGTSPTRPAIPSVITTLSFVSAPLR